MAYQALYRKWRPSDFTDVKGQDHIVTTLKNQIMMDRIGHAYLFCGTRGTGKTSVAKIFAKAVNCLHPVDGNPCNECEMCQAINKQISMNVMEIDAASNNGVDNIREIREEVEYTPTEGKYKVYIIDEVHMLSTGAFNALLKTLEEPPSYVIFILATTEVHKIPITIMSRCQRYDFKRITVDTIADRLNELVQREQLAVEDKAIRYIARSADGALRDALSLLDQCTAFYINEKITYDKVLEVLGAVDMTIFSKLYRCIIQQDLSQAIYMLEEIVMQGRELGQFVNDFIWYMRNLMMVQSMDQAEDVLDVSEENLIALKEEADMTDTNALFYYIKTFSELAGQMKYSSQKRVLLEVALVKLCKPSKERSLDEIFKRLAVIENQIEHGIIQKMPAKQSSQGLIDAQEDVSAQKKTYSDAKLMSEDVQRLIEQWGKIKSDLPNSMRSMLSGVRLGQADDSTILFTFDKALNSAYWEQEEQKQIVEEVICEKLQKNIKVKAICSGQAEEVKDLAFDPNKFNFETVHMIYED